MLVPSACAALLASKAHLSPNTRRTYFYELARFERAFPGRTLSSITLAELEEWLAGLPPGLGHNITRRLRTAYRFWHRRYACPLLAPQTVHRRRGYTPWQEADVAAYRARWPLGTRQRHIFEAALATGLRRADLARLLWPHGLSRGQQDAAKLTTAKTGAPIYLKPDPALDYGPPLAPLSLGLAFRLWARAAGVWKPLHGVRKLAAQRAAEAGCTGPELCALFGWASLRIAEVYVRGSPRLAASGLAKLGRV